MYKYIKSHLFIHLFKKIFALHLLRPIPTPGPGNTMMIKPVSTSKTLSPAGSNHEHELAGVAFT